MASSTNNDSAKQRLFFEEVLAKFSEIFSAPSSEILSTRCISRSLLLKHLGRIRDELQFPGYKRIARNKILLHLERSKIVQSIETIAPSPNETKKEFYLLGLTSNKSNVDPIDLLQALEPKGVICYFTALEFYGLTTQLPSHHHIAKLAERPNEQKEKTGYSTEPSSENRLFDPLGKKAFIYEGTPYYVTNRTKNLVPGVKERYLNEKTKFRITTLEQTILDTLHKPLSCGGPSVVFEAWENAIEEIKDETILEYLSKIDNPALSRRVGYMLDIMNYEIGNGLHTFLESVKNAAKENDTAAPIPLLPGLNYNQINHEWLVRVP